MAEPTPSDKVKNKEYTNWLKHSTTIQSEKIYWANSDVSLWPSNPWECAKIFLPRGQQPVNNGPAKSDAQALMVLLANCKHFHLKLSQQSRTLTHTISSIRNKVMHNGEMKVSDADRMSFIQQIIQLLEDPISLMSVGDCKAAVSNIHKINSDSLDVSFNLGLQMEALMAAVNELRQELGMQKKNKCRQY
ncbi:hypothetical protein CHS0354_004724 [Potamilus streckersoni]|uniref:Uncharacterized protein n=1 Tax=Potamilus streckersoni TaxID=2493646 RepID=A0AAE0T5N3_9BIVA|nr:hypothetical protein CHS0354_004724 [Potamilus streckersoni]